MSSSPFCIILALLVPVFHLPLPSLAVRVYDHCQYNILSLGLDQFGDELAGALDRGDEILLGHRALLACFPVFANASSFDGMD